MPLTGTLHACAAAAVIAAVPLRAQPSPAPETTRHSIWLVYSGDHPVSGRVGLVLDAQLRLVQNADHERQVLARPGISFALTGNVKLSGGYAVSASRLDTDDPLVSHRPEHRLWASAQLSHHVGSVALAHRYRLEHRWLTGVNVDASGGRIGEAWVTAERMRYSLRAVVPLTGSAQRHSLYAAASDEVFASFGGYARDIAVDQNRAALALGMRLSPSSRIEIGYLLQSSADDAGRFTERNHTLQIGVASTMRLRR
jgi:hypothetical protein